MRSKKEVIEYLDSPENHDRASLSHIAKPVSNILEPPQYQTTLPHQADSGMTNAQPIVREPAPWLEPSITDSGLRFGAFGSFDPLNPDCSPSSESNYQIHKCTTDDSTGKDTNEDSRPAHEASGRTFSLPHRPPSKDTDLYGASVDSQSTEAPSSKSINSREDLPELLSLLVSPGDAPQAPLLVPPAVELDDTDMTNNGQPGDIDISESIDSDRARELYLNESENGNSKCVQKSASNKLRSANKTLPGKGNVRRSITLPPPARVPPVPPCDDAEATNNTPTLVSNTFPDQNQANDPADGGSTFSASQLSDGALDPQSSTATKTPSTITSRASSISRGDPSAERERAQMELKRLQQDLAEAKARGDKKSAQNSLQKSIQVITETYLSTKTPSDNVESAAPSKSKSRHSNVLRLPSIASITQFSSRIKKSQAKAVLQASQSGDAAKLKELLDQGVNVNTHFKDLTTPMIQAGLHGHIECMQLLRERGVDEHAVDGNGRNVLHLTVFAERSDSVIWLLRTYCSPEDLNPHEMSLNIDKVPRPTIKHSRKSLLEASDVGGSKPLHVAIQQCSMKMVSILLDHGADIEAKTNWNETPLHLAIVANHQKIVQTLLSSGAKPNASDARGYMPLHQAAHLDRANLIPMLLARGAQSSRFDSEGDFPIHTAARHGHIKALDALTLEVNNLHLKNASGDCLLQIAVVANQIQVAEHLLKASAPSDFDQSLHVAGASVILYKIAITRNSDADHRAIHR